MHLLIYWIAPRDFFFKPHFIVQIVASFNNYYNNPIGIVGKGGRNGARDLGEMQHLTNGSSQLHRPAGVFLFFLTFQMCITLSHTGLQTKLQYSLISGEPALHFRQHLLWVALCMHNYLVLITKSNGLH